MMRSENMTKGFSLSELLVVMAIIGLLIGISVPASKMLTDSFASSEGTVMIIGAALANARAIAASEGTYAGLRFQQDQAGNQYMIFIIHSPGYPVYDGTGELTTPGTGLAYGFRAVQGRKPVRLPVNAGVMDLRIRTNWILPKVSSDTPVISDNEINDEGELTDTTTFSIVFSAVGKLVIHDVRVRNRDGLVKSFPTADSSDDVFNKQTKISSGIGMFRQDDYADLGLGQEPSRRSFVVYDKKFLAGVNANSRYSGYLKNLKVMYVNPYTGDIIKSVP